MCHTLHQHLHTRTSSSHNPQYSLAYGYTTTSSLRPCPTEATRPNPQTSHHSYPSLPPDQSPNQPPRTHPFHQHFPPFRLTYHRIAQPVTSLQSNSHICRDTTSILYLSRDRASNISRPSQTYPPHTPFRHRHCRAKPNSAPHSHHWGFNSPRHHTQALSCSSLKTPIWRPA